MADRFAHLYIEALTTSVFDAGTQDRDRAGSPRKGSGMQEQDKQPKREGGFTLIELLIAIVVVGVLTAVAIVGIGGLVDNGHTAACQSSADAAKAASAVFYANSGTSTFPSDFHDLVSPNKTFDIPAGVTPTAPVAGNKVLTGKGWTLTMSLGGATAPSFVCGA